MHCLFGVINNPAAAEEKEDVWSGAKRKEPQIYKSKICFFKSPARVLDLWGAFHFYCTTVLYCCSLCHTALQLTKSCYKLMYLSSTCYKHEPKKNEKSFFFPSQREKLNNWKCIFPMPQHEVSRALWHKSLLWVAVWSEKYVNVSISDV